MKITGMKLKCTKDFYSYEKNKTYNVTDTFLDGNDLLRFPLHTFEEKMQIDQEDMEYFEVVNEGHKVSEITHSERNRFVKEFTASKGIIVIEERC